MGRRCCPASKTGVRRCSGLITAAERDALLGDDQPVRVWRNVMTIDAYGVPVPRARDGKEMLPSVWGHINRWFVKFHRDIVSSLVVFDQEAVMGLTLVQLADYATMRGAARMHPANGDEPMATILALFAHSGRNIAELTSFDIGYLRSLYWERPDEAAVTKLLRVRRLPSRPEMTRSIPDEVIPGGYFRVHAEGEDSSIITINCNSSRHAPDIVLANRPIRCKVMSKYEKSGTHGPDGGDLRHAPARSPAPSCLASSCIPFARHGD